jgi:hypothetical protein
MFIAKISLLVSAAHHFVLRSARDTKEDDG